jgi:DNA-binding NarL/FixJ family response regulator
LADSKYAACQISLEFPLSASVFETASSLGRKILEQTGMPSQRIVTLLGLRLAPQLRLVTAVNLLVAQFSASDQPEIVGITPQQINTQFFARSSKFVLWCHEHRDLVTVHPDLAQLLQENTGPLQGDGIPEPSASVPPPSQVTNPIPNSETLVSSAAPGVETDIRGAEGGLPAPVSAREDGVIRIVIASGHPTFRAGLRALLTLEEDFRIVAEAHDGREVLEVFEQHQPDVLLLDLTAPSLDGLMALKSLWNSSAKAKLILIASEESQLIRATKSGPRSSIRKPNAAGFLIKSIRKVHAAGICLDSRTTTAEVTKRRSRVLQRALPRGRLSARESEIIALLAQGFKNRQIAEIMLIAEQTVKNHLHSIFCKLGVYNRLELACYAIRKGLLIPAPTDYPPR